MWNFTVVLRQRPYFDMVRLPSIQTRHVEDLVAMWIFSSKQEENRQMNK